MPGFVDEHRPLDSCRIEASVLFEKQRKTGTAIGNADDSLPVAESAVEGEHIHAGCVTVGDGVAMLVLETAEVLGGEGGATCADRRRLDLHRLVCYRAEHGVEVVERLRRDLGPFCLVDLHHDPADIAAQVGRRLGAGTDVPHPGR